MKKFFGFARRKSSSSLKGLNPRRFSIGSSASSTTLQIQVVRGGYNVDLGKVDASFTKLHKAALLNDEQKVRKQIKHIDVNARDSSDRTALHLATVNGNLKIIRTLVEARANVNAQDCDGKTPIVKAIECNHEELVQFFLFAGADAELADYENGNTPLHWALASGSLRAAQFLLRNAKTLNVNKTNNLKETSLHLAVKLPQLSVIIEDIIANGAQIDAKDDRGKTALMIATANDNAAAVAVLLKYGSSAYLSDEDRHQSNNNINNNHINSIKENGKDMHDIDSDSWPETDEEDSNYDKPIIELVKPRIGSFKRDQNRVSSLVDETIIEELKSDETADTEDEAVCKPSTSHKLNENINTGGVKLIWNETSSSDDETNKISVEGTLGRTDTLQEREELWTSNATNEVINIKESEDPFNVMDDIETLLQESLHQQNDDFIAQIQDLLEEEPNKSREITSTKVLPLHDIEKEIQFDDMHSNNVVIEQPKNVETNVETDVKQNANQLSQSEPFTTQVEQTITTQELKSSNLNVNNLGISNENSIDDLKRRSCAEDVTPEYLVTKPVEELRRRSYAEVVAQPKVKQAVIDELKVSISKRAKSYADVVSNSKIPEAKQLKINNNSNSILSNQNNKQLNNECNNLHSNKKLSKIPLPVKQSPTHEPNVRIDTEITTSQESIVSNVAKEDHVKMPVKQLIARNTDIHESPIKVNIVENIAINLSELQQEMAKLKVELEKEKNERAILAAENDIFKDQMIQQTKRTQDDSFAKFELEKRLIKLEAELNQSKLEYEIKCKENHAIKSELEQTVGKCEHFLTRNQALESDNQKLTNQIELISVDKENLIKQMTQRSHSPLNLEDITADWKVKIDKLEEENSNLKKECDHYKKIAIERQLDYERERLEWQKRILELDSELKRMQVELDVKTFKSPEEQLELIKAIRELNILMVKLDDRITRNEEIQQQKARSFNEEMFECARNLLDQMRLELTNFKQMLANSTNHEFKGENDEKQLSAFELRIAELRSSLERLEDQIQSQELQLIRQSDIISFASPLRKSSSSRELFISNNKPKSWFVQTLFRLQSHIQSTPTGDSISAFAHQKKNLQKQIHELKSELGLFAESVH